MCAGGIGRGGRGRPCKSGRLQAVGLHVAHCQSTSEGQLQRLGCTTAGGSCRASARRGHSRCALPLVRSSSCVSALLAAGAAAVLLPSGVENQFVLGLVYWCHSRVWAMCSGRWGFVRYNSADEDVFEDRHRGSICSNKTSNNLLTLGRVNEATKSSFSYVVITVGSIGTPHQAQSWQRRSQSSQNRPSAKQRPNAWAAARRPFVARSSPSCRWLRTLRRGWRRAAGSTGPMFLPCSSAR